MIAYFTYITARQLTFLLQNSGGLLSAPLCLCCVIKSSLYCCSLSGVGFLLWVELRHAAPAGDEVCNQIRGSAYPDGVH